MNNDEKPLSDHELRVIREIISKWRDILTVLYSWNDVALIIEADKRVKWLFSKLSTIVLWSAAFVGALGVLWNYIRTAFGWGE